MQKLKQSTAATTRVGPILDSSGVEYASAVIGDLDIVKNGTGAAMASAATLTYAANGYYSLLFTTGNTDTLGRLDITINKSTYQMPPKSFEVLQATVFDALITNATTASGGLGDIQRMAGTVLTARDIGASVLLSTGTGTGQLDFTTGVVKANLPANSINGAAFQLGVRGSIGGQLLVTSASTSPLTAANWELYYTTPIFNLKPVFVGFGGAIFMWWDSSGSQWVINATIGTVGSNYFRNTSVLPTAGSFTAVGTNTGAPFFTAVSPLDNSVFGIVSRDSSGNVAANMTQILGTAVSTPATAGILDINLKNIANAAVSTTTAQLGVNTVKYNNQTSQTDANNLPKVDVEDIKGTASAGDAGYVGTDHSFITNPTATVALSGTTVGTVTTTTTVTNLTNAPTVGDFTATMKASITTAVPTAAAITTAVWAAGTRSLTTFGTLTTDTASVVWSTIISSATSAGSIMSSLLSYLGAYVAAPTASQNATAVANTLYVDGVSNKQKVNADGTVNIDSSGIVSGVVSALESTPLDANVVKWRGQDVSPTIPTVVPVDGTKPNLIKIKRGDTISLPLSLGVDISSRTTLRFTAKKSPISDSDDQSIIQVVSGTGLRVLNGSLSGFNAAWGSISVEDSVKGSVTLHLSSNATSLLVVQTLQWDFQWSFSGGDSTPLEGSLNVTIDVTKTIN